ncbi:[NiFe]-hydrogenase assembly chaperone HybE [Morganella sp. HSTU-ASny43]|uniref:[NiFe]-hydrogenase assembly chaperone HybE n=1 Tax=Morganella sp. HSTU-ASny43 TaxID=2681968 RepID=UPI001FB620BF|nr:[NiFe]-hydrogenase assembly chaperone HybE [Morganella sp. HSTU-ASny43]MCJ1903923.1 [NiFe]-hydrogenase assembly chaperone HybE [Morganella sp. HSTU-ASny43]
MPEDIQGFMHSPTEQIRNAFEKVAADTMHDLTFLHPSMPVYVTELTLFEGQWTGCVITPWMFSAVIFPGPEQLWPQRKVSEKIGLRLADDSARMLLSLPVTDPDAPAMAGRRALFTGKPVPRHA